MKSNELVTINGFEKYKINRAGHVFGRRGKRISTLIHRGYVRTSLYVDNKNQKSVLLHRLIATAFVPNQNNKPFVNHINGIKNDNRIENLEWVTHSENIQHSFAIGTSRHFGERHINAKLDTLSVLIIREAVAQGFRQKDLARYFKVTPGVISAVKRGASWKSV